MRSARAVAGPSAESPSKATFRALLTRSAPRLGLTTAAIDALVRQSQITRWRAGEPLFDAGDAHDLVSFLVAGAVRVVCHADGELPVTVQVVHPGQFFGLTSLFDPPGPRLFGATAHTDAIAAVLSHQALVGVMETLPPRKALQLMAYTWRALSRLLYEKTLMLTMPLPRRLRETLAGLAHDFGRADADGIVIRLPLTQQDLADMVVGSRANVSRCLAALRRARLLDTRGRQLVLTSRFLAEHPRARPAAH